MHDEKSEECVLVSPIPVTAFIASRCKSCPAMPSEGAKNYDVWT
jgi:hypothetical protein